MRNFIFVKQKNNLVASIINLLDLLDIEVTVTRVEKTLFGNPNYPSLLAISESLKQWKIDSDAYMVSPENLLELPVPFIAYMKDNGSFLTVKEIKDDHVTYLNDEHSEIRIKLGDFINQWSGNVLLAEALPGSGQSDYVKDRKRELFASLRLPVLFFLFLVIASIKIAGSLDQLAGSLLTLNVSFWMTTVLGTVITSLLLWYEYDNNNSLINKICSINKKTNCNAVLTSKGSKIFGFSWSEVGFFYFIGAFFYLCISTNYLQGLRPLVVLNIIALPYIIFSVYYQAVIVKQWCALCLAVQCLLLGEFLIVLFSGNLNSSVFADWGHIEYSKLLLAYFLPALLWINVKPHLYKSKEGKETQYSFLRFRNNPEVFTGLQQKQSALANNPEGLGISLGNPNAENTLIKVCNPYCGPCARSFPHVEELLQSTNGNWHVQIIFTAPPDKNDRRSLTVAHFLEIRDRDNHDGKVLNALGDWYNGKDKNYDSYARKYPVEFNFEDQQPKLASMDEWCKKEKIAFTPTYYVNGRMLPEDYNIEDLKNIFY